MLSKSICILPLIISPLLIACSSDEEDLIKQQQLQIQQLQYQLQTSGVQDQTTRLQDTAQYQQPQSPIVVQSHEDNGLLGGMAGFMLGQALSNNGNSNYSTHTERHYITNNTSAVNPPANKIRDTPRLPTTIRNQANQSPAKPASSFWSSKPRISSGTSRPFSSSKSPSSFRPSIRRK